MRWDAPDVNLTAAVHEISAFRAQNRDVLAHGRLETLRNDSGLVAYLRCSESGTVFAAVNRSEQIQSVGTPDGRTRVIAPWSYQLARL